MFADTLFNGYKNLQKINSENKEICYIFKNSLKC